jgi:hypothetical protein
MPGRLQGNISLKGLKETRVRIALGIGKEIDIIEKMT